MICAHSDYYQGDTLEGFRVFFFPREHSRELWKRRMLQMWIHNKSTVPPTCAYISKCWLKADGRGRNDTSPSSAWSFHPNKETLLNSEQLSSLIFLSPGRKRCSLCLCPQLDSTPWACKLIKKLGGTISLTRWKAIVSWWCAWYSVGLHYHYNSPPFSLTHTHLRAGITLGTSNLSSFFSSLVQREIWEECALNFKVGGLIVFFIKAAV